MFTHQLYPAFVERTSDGFSIYFPDLPIGGAGDTVEAAYDSAVEAGALYAAELAKDGGELPPATPAEDAKPEEGGDLVAAVLVPVPTVGRAVRCNITLPENLVAAIDQVTDNRSRFLADAARERLAGLAG